MNQRIREKIYEVNTYLEELRTIIPDSYKEYKESIAVKRGCERLLQIIIECIIDILFLTAKTFKLSIPYDESNLIDELKSKNIIKSQSVTLLKNMKGFRNILVHRYGKINDELVFEYLQNKLDDFQIVFDNLEKSWIQSKNK